MHFRDRRLAASERARFLDSVVERIDRAAQSGERPIVVFDLDGTLMDNRPRVVAILRELADAWQTQHPDAATKCRAAKVEEIGYGVIDNLKHLGIDEPALHEEAFAFWKARFFIDEYIRYDVEVPGALAFARRCYEAGARLSYLTGRDLPNMSLGTYASLRDLGFPIGVVGTELVTKPDFDTPDAVFKRGVAPAYDRYGQVIAAFDNEAANCNLFLEFYPQCAVTFVDTQYAPNPPPLHESARVIEHF